MRPEDFLPVSYAARIFAVSEATLYNAINAGKLRCHVFGAARRLRPEDLEAYAEARG